MTSKVGPKESSCPNRPISFHSDSGKEGSEMIIRMPKTKIPRNYICLRGIAKERMELYCKSSEKTKRRNLYKKENRQTSKKITIQVTKKTFPINVLKVSTCTAVGVGIGAVGFATPAAPIAGPVGMAAGGVVGFAVGSYWASRTIKERVKVTIDNSNEYALWRLNKIENEAYPIFANFLDSEKRFKKFMDPVTGELILIPVKAPDGHVYDWESIESYIDALTEDPNGKVPSPLEPGMEFCKEDLVFDRKFCLDLIKKTERTYNRVVQIQDEYIKAEGLKAVIDNTKHVMEFIREQVEASVYQDLQPKVDSEEISEAERDKMVARACVQWDFRKR